MGLGHRSHPQRILHGRSDCRFWLGISLSSGLEGYVNSWLHMHSRSTWSSKVPLGWGMAAAGLLLLLAYCLEAAQWALDTASADLLLWNTIKRPAVPSQVHCNIKWLSIIFACLLCLKSTTPPALKQLTLFLNPQHRNALMQTRSSAEHFLIH